MFDTIDTEQFIILIESNVTSIDYTDRKQNVKNILCWRNVAESMYTGNWCVCVACVH